MTQDTIRRSGRNLEISQRFGDLDIRDGPTGGIWLEVTQGRDRAWIELTNEEALAIAACLLERADARS